MRVFLADPPGSALYHRVQHGVLYAPQQQERTVRRNRCGRTASWSRKARRCSDRPRIHCFLLGARHRCGGRRPAYVALGHCPLAIRYDTNVEGVSCEFFSLVSRECFFLVRYDTIMEGVGCDRLTANFAAARIDAAFRVSDEAARDGAAPLPCSCERRPFTTRAVCA